jgi:hypothetical protein
MSNHDPGLDGDVSIMLAESVLNGGSYQGPFHDSEALDVPHQ